LALVGGAAAFLLRRETVKPMPVTVSASPASREVATVAPPSSSPEFSPNPVPAPTAVRAAKMEWSSPAELAHAGRATPRDTLETLLLALVESDVDTLVSGMSLGPKARERAELRLARLTEEARTKFGPPEKFIVLNLLGNTPAAIQRVRTIRVVGQTEIDREVTELRVQMQDVTGLVQEQDFQFQ